MLPAYTDPLPLSRPHGSYRFDVFSTKAKRRMTLCGKPTLCKLVELEADPDVTAICERPIVIPDIKPKRVVDFWSLRGQVSTYHLLLRRSEIGDAPQSRRAYVEFKKWVADEHARLEEVSVDAFEGRRVRIENWVGIMRDLGLHQAMVNDALLDRCAEVLPARFTLNQAEGLLAELDPMLVRAAIFTLLSRANLTCPSIDSKPLHPKTEFVRP